MTAEQADRGRIAYEANCVACHGPGLVGGSYGTPLTGAYFDGKWRGKSVGALYEHAQTKMPPSRPGTLPEETYADIVAYILQLNGVTAGTNELPSDTAALSGMTIPAK